MSTVSVEYNRWKEYKAFGRKVRLAVGKGAKVQYNVSNCLSRFFLCIHNYPERKGEYYAKLVGELTKKGGKVAIPPMVRMNHVESQNHQIDRWIQGSRCIFRYLDFKVSIPKRRYEQWLELGIPDKQILAMLLRYDAILCDNGNFWSLHPVICSAIKACGANLECFASPLNCNFDSFCSLFVDTDAPFGSRGSFFDVVPNLGSGVYMANPPFIESIMVDSIRLILDLLDRSEGITFFMYLPKWDDCPEIASLYNGKYTVDCIPLPKGEHCAYDHIKEIDIPAYFEAFLVVLSNSNVPYGCGSRDLVLDSIANHC